MSATTLDTVKFLERLEKAGLSRDQAAAIVEAQKDAFAEALDSSLATKADIAWLERSVDSLGKDMLALEYRLIIKLGAFIAVAAGVVIAVLCVAESRGQTTVFAALILDPGAGQAPKFANRLGKARRLCLLMLALLASIRGMKGKHAKTLRAVFAQPTLASIAFSDIEALVVALGGLVVEREGSRVRIELNGEEWRPHRPHPGKEAKRYQVEEFRKLLELTGVKP